MQNQIREQSGLLDMLNRLEEQRANKATIGFGFDSYLDRKAREQGVPIRGTFELTPRCNLDCKMCYIHLTDEQLKFSNKPQLSGVQWMQIMQQAIDHGLLYALLTGGEAMLHPDFDELYMLLRQNGVQVSVNTNGLLLTEGRIDFFKQHLPAEIRITLYGADEETYEKVTGRRVFGNVIRNIQAARDAGITISVGITPSKYLQDGIEDVVKLVKSMGIKYGINSSLSEPREETGRDGIEHDMSLDAYIQMYKRLQEMDDIVLTPVCEENIPMPHGNNQETHKGFRCGGGRSSFAVLWNGCIQPCLTIDEFQVDLTEVSFEEAWKRVNTFVSEYPVPQECYGCPYEGFCTVCVASHAKGAPVGHANPMLCERAKRFVREGLIVIDRKNESGVKK